MLSSLGRGAPRDYAVFWGKRRSQTHRVAPALQCIDSVVQGASVAESLKETLVIKLLDSKTKFRASFAADVDADEGAAGVKAITA